LRLDRVGSLRIRWLHDACRGRRRVGDPGRAHRAGPFDAAERPAGTVREDNQADRPAAIDYVNSHLGGIAGHKIELVTVDDQNNATTGVQVAEELVNDGVADVIGNGINPINLQENPVFDKAHVPVVAFNAVSSATSDPYVFSDSADNSVVASVTAKLIATQKLSPAGFISDGAPSTVELRHHQGRAGREPAAQNRRER
jgi:ABC-type branched-subunit amino acid transport system substrate-binding protein